MKVTLLATLLLIITTSYTQAFQYPTETSFSEVPVIEISDLHAGMNSILILDVRSSPEFNTAHIKGAEHCKVSQRIFLKNAKQLLSASGKKQIVTYCNGPTCLKAPKAASILIAAGVNAKSLYAGVPSWADSYPEFTILRGKPISADNRLIPKGEFKKRCLDFEAFKIKAGEPNSLVIDVRDAIQSSGKLPLGKVKVLKIPLDKFIPNFVIKKKEPNKTLLIFDQVGKQVQALEYDLLDNGYSNYYFLAKGATKVLGKQIYKK